MIASVLGLFWLDGVLDHVRVPSALQWLFFGEKTVPRGIVMLGLLYVLIIMGARELRRIFAAKGVQPNYVMMVLAASLGGTLIWIMPDTFDAQHALAFYASVGVFMFMITLIVHSWGGKPEGAVMASAAVLMTMIYLGVLPGFYLAARRFHSSWVVLCVILVTKSCDIGAYFTGRAIGRHKLIPWLSPGKTWEGLFGGLAFSAGLSVLLVALANRSNVWHDNLSMPGGHIELGYTIPLWAAALSGVALGAMGQLGDLTASLFKRDAGIKDSGSSVPGFGGVLDVLDSPVVIAPLAYWLLAAAANSSLWD